LYWIAQRAACLPAVVMNRECRDGRSGWAKKLKTLLGKADLAKRMMMKIRFAKFE